MRCHVFQESQYWVEEKSTTRVSFVDVTLTRESRFLEPILTSRTNKFSFRARLCAHLFRSFLFHRVDYKFKIFLSPFFRTRLGSHFCGATWECLRSVFFCHSRYFYFWCIFRDRNNNKKKRFSVCRLKTKPVWLVSVLNESRSKRQLFVGSSRYYYAVKSP